jgi:hypothetical protein
MILKYLRSKFEEWAIKGITTLQYDLEYQIIHGSYPKDSFIYVKFNLYKEWVSFLIDAAVFLKEITPCA